MAEIDAVHAEVTFLMRSDLDQEALMAKARELDEENGCDEPEEGYSLVQAIQTVWHNEPEWLHQHILVGWTLDRATDEAGNMRYIWPELD